MPTSPRDRLTLLPGGLTALPPPSVLAQSGGDPPCVDALLTVQEGNRQVTLTVTLVRGDDGHWRGRSGRSVDVLLDAVWQRALDHLRSASDSRRRV